MELAKNNNLISMKSNTITRTKPLSFDIGMCLLYTALIVLGMFTSLGSIAAFLLIVVVFYTIPLENIVAQMVFLMSFANIFKLNPASTSLFTVIELYVVLLMLWRRPSFKAKELLVLVLLAISVLFGVLFSSNLQILLSIKFIAAMLLIMGFKNTDYQKELPNYISLFILGLLLSSAIAYFGDGFFPIDLYFNRDYVVDSNWQGSFRTDTVRFSGLNADPNYYSINIYIGIIGALILNNKGAFKNKLWVYLGVIALFLFGVQTVSKSFALMLFIIVLYLFFVSAKNKNWGMVIVLLAFTIMVIILALTQKVEIINTMIERIANSFDKNDITTGRTSIWESYFDYLSQNPKLMLFGAGFGYGFGGLVAAHNTYLESIASLGIIGSILLIITIAVLFIPDKRFKRGLDNYSIVLVIFIMYFFLSMLTWADFPFQLFFGYCFVNYFPEKVIGNEISKFNF